MMATQRTMYLKICVGTPAQTTSWTTIATGFGNVGRKEKPMPTFVYRLADNTRVPSVTTINKIGQEAGGLIHWAWSLGMDGKDYRQARDDAAEAGTVGHLLVDAAVHDKEADLSSFPREQQELGRRAFGAYKEWRGQTRLEVIHSEIPLVSELNRYGGCIDAVAKNANGALCLCDWKTGSLYPDHLCQVAAYRWLWEENYPGQLIEGGYHLCRFNRETGDFSHSYFANLNEAWEAFKLKRQLYDLLGKLKKRV